jgi:hypothetical protein
VIKSSQRKSDQRITSAMDGDGRDRSFISCPGHFQTRKQPRDETTTDDAEKTVEIVEQPKMSKKGEKREKKFKQMDKIQLRVNLFLFSFNVLVFTL